MSGKPPAPDDPRFIAPDQDSRVRERMQKAEKGHELRPGALCPHCGGHAFKRAELKAGAPCPACGKPPRVAA
jgi:predicted Zn-ribbon and HTH transcriptional regulator